MPVEVDVKQGLIDAVITAVAGSLPIKVPGITFAIPDDQKYFEILLFTDRNTNENWGDSKLHSGILRVILHWPIDGQGIYPPIRVVSNLAQSFPKGRIIWYGEVSLLIYDVPAVMDVIEGGAANLYPLTVPYQFFNVPE